MESFFKSSSSASGSNPAKKAKIDLNVNSTCKVLSLWEWDCLIHIIFVVWHWYNSLISVIMLYSRSLQSPQVIDFAVLFSVQLFSVWSAFLFLIAIQVTVGLVQWKTYKRKGSKEPRLVARKQVGHDAMTKCHISFCSFVSNCRGSCAITLQLISFWLQSMSELIESALCFCQ